MNLSQILVRNYNIEPIIKIEKTENGSGNTYFVESELGKYIAKTNERIDFVNIYDKVQLELNGNNILQSKIIRTNEDMVITEEGLVLYEFINGNNSKTLNEKQLINAIKYIAKYNEALRRVPFNEEEIEFKNHWDSARSIDFITNEFPNHLIEADIDIENKKNIYDAIEISSKNKEKMLKQNKQLIHSDLGPDNFMIKNDEIISIIDFTPEYNHELYSLCQFIYWNYLWDNQSINKEQINSYLRIYNNNDNQKDEITILYLLLIRTALYRIIGRLMEMLKKNIEDYTTLKRRFKILGELLRVYDVNKGCNS